MLTIFVELLMSRLIADYKVEKYPYSSNFIKGILIGLVGFFIGMVPDVFNGNVISYLNIFIYFFICQLIGFGVAVFLIFLYWIEHNYKGN